MLEHRVVAQDVPRDPGERLDPADRRLERVARPRVLTQTERDAPGDVEARLLHGEAAADPTTSTETPMSPPDPTSIKRGVLILPILRRDMGLRLIRLLGVHRPWPAVGSC